MGNRNRTIELSTVPVRDHCPSGEGRHNALWLRVYDSIFVVSDRTCGLYGIGSGNCHFLQGFTDLQRAGYTIPFVMYGSVDVKQGNP